MTHQVETPARTDPGGSGTEVLFPEARRRRRRRRLVTAGVAVVLVAAAVGGYEGTRQGGHPAAAPQRQAPPAPAPRVASPVSWSGALPHHPYALATGGNDLYVVDAARDQVLRRAPSGRLHVVAGDGRQGSSGDGGPATRARLRLTAYSGVAVGPDGAVYIADSGNRVVREVQPGGTIVTVAGGGRRLLATTSVSARAARFPAPGPQGLTIGPDGALYVGANGVYRLHGGTLTWVVGETRPPPQGAVSDTADPAVQEDFDPAERLAFDGAGDLLVAGGGGFGLYERTASGQLRYLENFRGDGYWGSLAPAPDGDVVLADRGGLSLFHPGGVITPVTGDLSQPLDRAGGHNVVIGGDGVAVAADGTIDLDTNSGNDFTSRSALLELPPGASAATALWLSAPSS